MTMCIRRKGEAAALCRRGSVFSLPPPLRCISPSYPLFQYAVYQSHIRLHNALSGAAQHPDVSKRPCRHLTASILKLLPTRRNSLTPAVIQARKQNKADAVWHPLCFGSPCWTRTNDTAVNSRMLYRCCAHIPKLPQRVQICVSAPSKR